MALPVADAGFDQLRFGGAEAVRVMLDGRASCDPMGEPLGEVSWRLLRAPGEWPALEDDSALRASFLAPGPGEYVLSLEVGTGDRKSEADLLSVRVEAGEGDDVDVAPPATNACGEPLGA
jgi:hypothetical protein